MKNYRPNGLDIEISEENTINLKAISKRPMTGVTAIYKTTDKIRNEVVLWEKDDVNCHLDHTDEVLINKIKEMLA